MAGNGRTFFDLGWDRVLKTILRTIVLVGAMALLAATPTFADNAPASASPVMMATCSPYTGVSISAEPKNSPDPGVYDPEAKAYVSHGHGYESKTITVYSDGTANAAEPEIGGGLYVVNMHVLRVFRGSYNTPYNPEADVIDGIKLIDNNPTSLRFSQSSKSQSLPVQAACSAPKVLSVSIIASFLP